MLSGWATLEGTRRLMARHLPEVLPSFYNQVQDVFVSSLGIGTAKEDLDDIVASAAVGAALNVGINVLDTSINYRSQLAERATASAIREFVQNGGRRDEIIVCTKAGYLVPGAIPESRPGDDDVAGNTHCIAPAFLADQLQRSRTNLGLETIDVYYLHNPETQLTFVDRTEFMRRIRAAFGQLERAASDNLLRYYGVATWKGCRTSPARGGLSLVELTNAAREVAGERHHFRFVELPFNLSMPEALTVVIEEGESALAIAQRLNLSIIASGTLFQSRLSRNLPLSVAELTPDLFTDAQRAIQFTRSTPGISCALVGMSDVAHVKENFALARVPPLIAVEYERLLALLS
jgi:aryl-alcohol dehydrogenase-like predicted oxidoreductase